MRLPAAAAIVRWISVSAAAERLRVAGRAAASAATASRRRSSIASSAA